MAFKARRKETKIGRLILHSFEPSFILIPDPFQSPELASVVLHSFDVPKSSSASTSNSSFGTSSISLLCSLPNFGPGVTWLKEGLVGGLVFHAAGFRAHPSIPLHSVWLWHSLCWGLSYRRGLPGLVADRTPLPLEEKRRVSACACDTKRKENDIVLESTTSCFWKRACANYCCSKPIFQKHVRMIFELVCALFHLPSTSNRSPPPIPTHSHLPKRLWMWHHHLSIPNTLPPTNAKKRSTRNFPSKHTKRNCEQVPRRKRLPLMFKVNM